jgi:hypothetical protein
MALTQPEVCRSELRAGCSKTEIAFKTAKRCFRLSVLQSAIETSSYFARAREEHSRLSIAVLSMAARPRSPQTSARSFRKPCENAVRLPTGRPLGFPETPGGHIRPFTCLLGSKAIPSVSFCYGREFLSTALPTSMTPPPDPRFSGDWAAAVEKDKARRAE